MDTTPAPPPPPPPLPPATPSPRADWWRQPLADSVDLLAVAAVATAAGLGVAFLYAAPSDDPWAGLAAALLGLAAAAVTALAGWVAVLVAIGTGRPTPGRRVAGLSGRGRPLVAAGRHVALVLGLWCLAVAVAATVEPGPTGPLGAAVGAALGTGLLVLAHGWGPPRTRLAIVGVALLAGGAVAAAVPDRAPHPWEVRTAFETLAVAELDADPRAVRDCGSLVDDLLGEMEPTSTCPLPDRVWQVERPPAVVAEELAVLARTVVPSSLPVRVERRPEELAVLVGDDPVAIVSALDLACSTSRVALDRFDARFEVAPTCP